jgi:hypothetical protein
VKAADRRKLTEAAETIHELDCLIARDVYQDDQALAPAAAEALRHLGNAKRWIDEIAWIVERGYVTPPKGRRPKP